jgi:hypothetical protein
MSLVWTRGLGTQLWNETLATSRKAYKTVGSNEAGNNNFLITTTEFNGRSPRTVCNVLMELRKVSSDQYFTG